MTRASEILPSLMLPFCNDRDRERQVICRKHTKEMKELEGKHHKELKAFDDRKAKEEMKLQAFCKEQAKELAYEGLLVRKVLQVSLSFFAIMLLDILSLSSKNRQGNECGGLVKKCRWLLSGEPYFLIAYDDEQNEEVFLPELVSMRSAVLQGVQSACGTPFSTSGTVAAKTGKSKVRIDYMHRKKLGYVPVCKRNPFCGKRSKCMLLTRGRVGIYVCLAGSAKEYVRRGSTQVGFEAGVLFKQNYPGNQVADCAEEEECLLCGSPQRDGIYCLSFECPRLHCRHHPSQNAAAAPRADW